MSTALPLIQFHQPFWLLALAILPPIWWLLRQWDRTPKQVVFPGARLLLGLGSTPPRARPPHWRRLLQLSLLACLILTLAQPFIPPRRPLIPPSTSAQPALIIIDNNGLAGQNWAEIQQTAIQLAQQWPADQPLYLLPTTIADAALPDFAGAQPVSRDQAEAIIRGWQPNAWPIAPDFAKTLSAAAWWPNIGQVFWLGSPLADGVSRQVIDQLGAAKTLSVLAPPSPQAVLTKLAQPDANASPDEPWKITVISAGGDFAETLQLQNHKGELLHAQNLALQDGEQTLALTAPPALLAQTTQLRLSSQTHGGGQWLLPTGSGGVGIGIIGDRGAAQNSPPLSQPAYYITKALQPMVEGGKLPLHFAPLTPLLAQNPSIILWPDDQRLNGDEAAALKKWVEQGGVLLRLGVAGVDNAADGAPTPTTITDALLPVTLLAQPRRLGGLLSPDSKQAALTVNPNAPLKDVAAADLVIQQLWLSMPDPQNPSQSWLSLNDGTPLLSARQSGQGWLLLLHVPATPNWSDVPISGFFPELLQNLVRFAETQPGFRAAAPNNPEPQKNASLPLWQEINGFGALVAGRPQATPLDPTAATPRAISHQQPPGYYGNATSALPLNPDWPSAELQPLAGESLEKRSEYPLQPALLLLISGLLLILVAMDALAGLSLKSGRGLAVLGLLSLIQLATAAPSLAQQEGASLAAPSLAYVRNQDAQLNQLCELGLGELGATVSMRTSLSLAAPIGLAVEVPEVQASIGRYPMLYWLVPPSDAAVSPELLAGLRRYIALGGLLVLDTGQRAQEKLPTAWAQAMAIPALSPMPADHVLTRSFYLLDQLSGDAAQQPSPILLASVSSGREVAPVVLAKRNWASAWANAAGNEKAMRSGINLTLYAFTGQYKADQVHLPTILQRLQQSTPVIPNSGQLQPANPLPLPPPPPSTPTPAKP
jgi:hypothetical protein